MSLSDDDPKSPTEKNRAGMNQESRESPKGSSFLSSKETDKKIMSEEMSSDEEPLKSLSNLLLETSHSSVSPKNNVEEPLKSEYGSYWENPSYFESHNITMNTGNLTMNPSDSLDSDSIHMMPNSGDVKNYSSVGMEQDKSLSDNPTSLTEKNQEPGESPQDSSFFSSEETEKKSETSMSKEMSSDEETLKTLCSLFWENDNTGNLLNPLDDILGGSLDSAGNMTSQIDAEQIEMMPSYQSNISPGSCKSIEPMKNAKRDKEEIKMIPTPGFFNRSSKWIIEKMLTKEDVNTNKGHLKLHKNVFEEYIQKQLPEAMFQDLVSTQDGINVTVYDHDTNTTHEMRLTLRGNNFHLMGGWGKDFVTRKSLREGQWIRLLYDSSDSMLHFSMLNLENASDPAKDKKVWSVEGIKKVLHL